MESCLAICSTDCPSKSFCRSIRRCVGVSTSSTKRMTRRYCSSRSIFSWTDSTEGPSHASSKAHSRLFRRNASKQRCRTVTTERAWASSAVRIAARLGHNRQKASCKASDASSSSAIISLARRSRRRRSLVKAVISISSLIGFLTRLHYRKRSMQTNVTLKSPKSAKKLTESDFCLSILKKQRPASLRKEKQILSHGYRPSKRMSPKSRYRTSGDYAE